MSFGRPVIGIIPAAGHAPLDRVCSHELLSVGEVVDRKGRRPRAISEHLVEAMIEAGAQHIYFVVAPDKNDIVQFYGFGERHGVSIGYLCQDNPAGISDAIDLGFEEIGGATVLMGMPDTIVRPASSLRQIRELLDRTACDVSLAVAPTAEPCRLGPVNVDAEGRVTEVLDQPLVAPHNRVWTVACWSPRFTGFLHDHLRHHTRTGSNAPLGLIVQSAIERGLNVRALVFDEGRYVDAGTVDGLAAARHLVESEIRN